MTTALHKQSLETAYRNWVIGQAPNGIYTVTGVGTTTTANTSIIEVLWAFRTRGAVQILGTPSAATIKIEGTLADPTVVADYDANNLPLGTYSFKVPSTDADYVTIASVSAAGITQITGAYTRIRVICTAISSGSFDVRVF